MARDRDSRLVYSSGGAPPGEKTAPGKAAPVTPGASGGKGIRIAVERRASGRAVTLVRGISGGAEALAELARELKAACGAGGTVRDDVIEIQGEQRAAVEAHLVARGLLRKR